MVNLTLPKKLSSCRRKNFGRKGKNTITFNVYRWNRESSENPEVGQISHKINQKLGPMVLDALMFIKNQMDPSLTFRRSCREGICGSCSMNVNGTNTLACLKPIEGEEINIYPLPHMRVLKDLIPDMSDFYKQYESIQPWLKNNKIQKKKNLQTPEGSKET